MAIVEHNVLTDPELHEPKGIATAVANTVYVADGATSGAFAQVSPSNTVMVHSASDLPTAAATVRTLAANTIYHIVGTVSIGADTLVLSSGTTLRGGSPLVDGIVTTSTGALLTGVGSHVVSNLFLTCASGDAFAFTGTGVELLLIQLVRVTSCDTLGTITAFGTMTLERLLCQAAATTGLTFAGAFNHVTITGSGITAALGICYDLGVATFNSISFNSISIDNASGVTGIDVAAAGANLNAGKVGVIHDCTFLTPATASNYVDGDAGWTVMTSPGVAASTAHAQGYIVDSALTTTFAGTGAGNEVIANFGAAWLESVSAKFTVTTAGVYTYTGVVDITAYVVANIYATIAGGASRTYNFYWRKNSTTDLSSVSQRDYDGTNAGSVMCSSIVDLAPGDTLALYIRAETATTAMTVDTVSTKIMQLGN